MTPERLEEIIRKCDMDQLVSESAGLCEADRRKLSKTVQEINKKIQKEHQEHINIIMELPRKHSISVFEVRKKFKGIFSRGEQFPKQLEFVKFAAMAFCPLSYNRRLRMFLGYKKCYEDGLLRIITDRKPEWLEEWIDNKLNGEWSEIRWSVIRPLMLQGLCSKRKTQGYLRVFISDFHNRWYVKKEENHVPLSNRLRKEPDILNEEIWWLFEVENDAFCYDGVENNPRAPENVESWKMAVCKLSESGDLDRGRLLDSCISGLSTGFKRTTLSGYMKVFDKLSPTVDEVVGRQQKLLDLLSIPMPHVVTFALKYLKLINRAKKLDDVKVLQQLGSALSIQSKAQPKAALQLLKTIVKRKPDFLSQAACLATQGLGHESSDIQQLTLDLLEAWNVDGDNGFEKEIGRYADTISPALKGRLDKYLVGSQAESQEDLSEDWSRSMEELKPLSPESRSLVNLPVAEYDWKDRTPLPALEFDILDVPILTGLEPVEAINSVEELIDACYHAMEVIETPDEVERILDGISRLCDRKGDDFERRTAPLFKRISDKNHLVERGFKEIYGVEGGLALLILNWILPGKVPVYEVKIKDTSVLDIFFMRMQEVAQRAVKGETASLLALPTHKHGWIDPVFFVERIIALHDSSIKIPKYDFIQGLLRLVGDRRREALEKAVSIIGIEGDVLRWALGGDSLPKKPKKKHDSLWLAAGRCRYPFKILNELKGLGIKDHFADGIEPARYTWKTYTKESKDKWSGKLYRFSEIEFLGHYLTAKINSLADLPTIALHPEKKKYEWDGIYAYTLPWIIKWIGTIWPINTEPYFASGVISIMKRIDMNASRDEPNFSFIEMLFEPDRPLSEMGILMLWVGLVGKDGDARGYAIEALSEAIDDGRAGAVEFGRVLNKLAEGGWVKWNRFKGALSEIAEMSPLHAWFVSQIIMSLVGSELAFGRDGHYMLGLLLDLVFRLQIPLDEDAIAALNKVKGSGKAAKLSGQLIDFDPQEASAEFLEARILELRARIDRANRWQLS